MASSVCAAYVPITAQKRSVVGTAWMPPERSFGSLRQVHLAQHRFVASILSQSCKHRVRLDVDYSGITLHSSSIHPIESLGALAAVSVSLRDLHRCRIVVRLDQPSERCIRLRQALGRECNDCLALESVVFTGLALHRSTRGLEVP